MGMEEPPDFPSAIAVQKAKTATTRPVAIIRYLCNEGSRPKNGIKIIQRPKTPLTQFCKIRKIFNKANKRFQNDLTF